MSFRKCAVNKTVVGNSIGNQLHRVLQFSSLEDETWIFSSSYFVSKSLVLQFLNSVFYINLMPSGSFTKPNVY